MVSETYADAPNGGIHNSTFLSSKDSHNLMCLRETNEKDLYGKINKHLDKIGVLLLIYFFFTIQYFFF